MAALLFLMLTPVDPPKVDDAALRLAMEIELAKLALKKPVPNPPVPPIVIPASPTDPGVVSDCPGGVCSVPSRAVGRPRLFRRIFP